MPESFVPFAVTVCGIPELGDHCRIGVSHVLSILDPGHPEPEAFGAYGEHTRLELRFFDVIEETDDMAAPSRDHVARVLRFGRDMLAAPGGCAHLLVHCHAGVSRSTAALAMLLAQARPDRPAADAMAAMVRIRPRAWPNLRMIELADGLLNRHGTLVAAARDRYRDMLRKDPELAVFMRETNRAREVDGLETV
jgi:predicted protein tyrosine phosphatase